MGGREREGEGRERETVREGGEEKGEREGGMSEYERGKRKRGDKRSI